MGYCSDDTKFYNFILQISLSDFRNVEKSVSKNCIKSRKLQGIFIQNILGIKRLQSNKNKTEEHFVNGGTVNDKRRKPSGG